MNTLTEHDKLKEGKKKRESRKLSNLVKTSFSPSSKLFSCDNFGDVGNSAQGVVNTTRPCLKCKHLI